MVLVVMMSEDSYDDGCDSDVGFDWLNVSFDNTD